MQHLFSNAAQDFFCKRVPSLGGHDYQVDVLLRAFSRIEIRDGPRGERLGP